MAANMGCLLLLAGTSYFPDLQNKILFLEDDPDETPQSIDRYLTQLCQIGVFKQIAGLVIGRFHSKVGLTEKELSELLLRVTRSTNFPILCNLDFGHTDPMMTIPNGILAEVVATNDETRISLLEAAVEA